MQQFRRKRRQFGGVVLENQLRQHPGGNVFSGLRVADGYAISFPDKTIDVFERKMLAPRTVVIAAIWIPPQLDPQSIGGLMFVVHGLCIRTIAATNTNHSRPNTFVNRRVSWTIRIMSAYPPLVASRLCICKNTPSLNVPVSIQYITMRPRSCERSLGRFLPLERA